MNIKNWLYEYYKEPAKMLLHTGAVSWTISSIAQVAAIAVNDKIPPEQKEFLIPQEMADGAINILSFILITSQATALGKKLVSTGKLISKPVREFVQNQVKDVKLGDFATNIKEIVAKDAKIKKEYDKFNTGVSVIASTIGAVIASNFLTPYMRNLYGANQQKKSLAKMNMQAVSPSTMNAVKIDTKVDNSVKKLSMNTPMSSAFATLNSSMKI